MNRCGIDLAGAALIHIAIYNYIYITTRPAQPGSESGGEALGLHVREEGKQAEVLMECSLQPAPRLALRSPQAFAARLQLVVRAEGSGVQAQEEGKVRLRQLEVLAGGELLCEEADC